jgi:hypothetical protein
MDRTGNTIPHCCNSIVVFILAEPLLRNRCCIFSYLTVIAQQQVCMPRYEQKSVDINFHLTKRENERGL